MSKQWLVTWVLGLAFVLFSVSNTLAISCDVLPDENRSDIAFLLNEYISTCGPKITEIQNTASSLSQAIKLINSKINFTQAQIRSTDLQISQLEKEISVLSTVVSDLNVELNNLSAVYISRVRETYKRRDTNPLIMFFTSDSFSTFENRLRYLQVAERRDQLILRELESSRLDFDQQKTIKEQKQDEVEILQKQLLTQKATLTSQQKDKQSLLTETQNSEKKYQQLLASAQSQLAALSKFAESVGIELIDHQEISDGWGKYFNQRDRTWGNVLINSQSGGCDGACTIAKVGCLITSYSMVVTHYGGSIIPSEVANNSSFFSPTTAMFNYPGPDANGHSAERSDNPSLDQLRNALNSGGVVIAGLSKNGGPYPTHYSDHWVVLRSVDGDSFKINDPLYQGAMNVRLTDKYSGWSIIQARIYH